MKKAKRLQTSSRIFLVISIAFLFLVSSCGGGTAPPSVPPKAKASIPARKKAAAPPQAPSKAEKKEVAKKEEPEYSYNPTGKQDPFKPFIQLTPSDKLPKGAFLTPLQKYDVSQLKLVAIITIPDGNVALVEDAQGKGYFLKKGALIGRNDGKVKTILKDKVIIEEVYLDAIGQSKRNEISLFLHTPEEGGES